MYVQVGDFRVSRGLTTVPLTRISCNTFFSKSQNARKAGTLRNLNDAGKKFKDKTEKQDYFLTAILSCLIIFYFSSFLLLKFAHKILEILCIVNENSKPFLKRLSYFPNAGNGFN